MSDARQDLLCEIFSSSRREGTYLFVEREEGLARVPEALLSGFGEPRSVMTLRLHQGRRLAQADPLIVLDQIRENGFYLQLPPASTGHSSTAAQFNGSGEDNAPC